MKPTRNLALNRFARYQYGLRVRDLYPLKDDNTCACGCGTKLIGRKTRWSSLECQNKAYYKYMFILGDTNFIRYHVLLRDDGFCRGCGLQSDDWEADHIIPVHLGGGACGIENYQTLCKECHKEKTYFGLMELQSDTISAQDCLRSSSLDLKAAVGASILDVDTSNP